MAPPKTTLPFVLHFMRQQWIKFFIFALASVAWGINDAIFPYLLKNIVNTLNAYHGVPQQVYHALKNGLILLALFWIGSETFTRIQGLIQIYAFPKFRASIRESTFNYVQAHSHSYFASNFAGSLANKLSDLPTNCQTLVEIIVFNFITASVGGITVLITMWESNPIFAIFTAVWIGIHLSITFGFLHKGNYLLEKHSDSVTTLTGKIVDVFTNIQNVKLFAREKYESSYLNRFQKEEIKKSQKAQLLLELMRIGFGLNGLLLIFGTLYLLINGWIHGTVTLGDFTQVTMQTFWLFGWMWYTSYQITIYAKTNATISAALSLVRKSHDIIDKPSAYPLKVTQGEIHFDKVDFAYHQRRVVFNDFNVTIKAGQKIGLVGFSGSGKSTFVNLILRFYDLKSGKILIDGQSIADVTQESLRSNIAVIPQDPSLFHRTLMENIRYGLLNTSDEEVIHAAKLAHCDDFIQRLDEGYQSLVGERGVKLSGGQRQRIAIARAILKNAPILILDEATSSLDTATEKTIQESLNFLMKDRTTIVVAHRLSTLSSMDRILVFDKGKIVEDGSIKELLKAKGHFSMLWNMQVDDFLPESE